MSTKQTQLLVLLILAAILIVLPACGLVSTGPARKIPVVVSDYCRIARPIGYDTRADSAATVTAIERHNSQWVCLCEGDCPADRP